MPNEMRDRLIELLLNAPQIPCVKGGQATGKRYQTFQNIADYLIANGVTVQECGHWEIIMDDYDCEMMCCSVCGSEFYDGDNDTVDCMHNYCPHCGAKMMPQPPKGEIERLKKAPKCLYEYDEEAMAMLPYAESALLYVEKNIDTIVKEMEKDK